MSQLVKCSFHFKDVVVLGFSCPKNYGIKIMYLCNVKQSYLLNAFIYTGRDSDSVGLSEEEKNLKHTITGGCEIV